MQSPNANLDLTALPLAELFDLREKAGYEFDVIAVKAQADSKPASDTINAVNAELARRFKPIVEQNYKDADKVSGATTIRGEGFGIKANISKSVSWDNAKLLKLAGEIPWEKAKQVFDFKVSVKESTYAALQKFEPALAAAVGEARTEKYGDLKFTVEPVQDKAA